MRENLHRELVELRPRVHQHYVFQNHAVLIMDPKGFITDSKLEGLLIYQTRSLSKYRYLIDGKEPDAVSVSPVQENSWMGYYIAAAPGKDKPEKATIELRLSRLVGHGFHEEADLTNYTQEPVELTLSLEVDADFTDQSGMSSDERKAEGVLTRDWRSSGGGRGWELIFDFRAEHSYDHQGDTGTSCFHQSIALRIEHADSPPSYENGRISFRVELAPHGSWHACVNAIPTVGEKRLDPLYGCRSFEHPRAKFDYEREKFLAVDAAHFSTPESGTLSSAALRTVERATRDLAAMRLYDLTADGGWATSAGAPEYMALYGRDSICSSWQASLLSTAMLRGTMPVLAALQGNVNDDWRDEQPDKMIHQASNGMLSHLDFKPFKRYYGSLTTSGVYPFALAALWQWTGDEELVRRYIDPALRAMHWRDTGGDLDGDGFSEYLSRSENGVKNQGWKDSGDAIVHADGSQVEPPIAPCEEQGFLYVAKIRMAEMLWWLGDKDQALRLFHEASELKKRFNEAFWMEEEGFFAMGLDAKKRQIRSISSNAGHVLETAIVDQALARRTADRLLSSDLFSGWGVRTLSSDHPAYDPFSYQRGSVWPAENGLFAIGMLRYGFHAHIERICRAQFEAAAMFQHYRMPEVFAGHPRDGAHPFPAVYPKANWPQAWSASAVFCLLYSMLGIFPYAPLKTLFVGPHLPDWLPEITIHNLHIANAILTIRFFRKPNGESDYKIEELEGKLHVVRQPSPWSETADLGERFQDALMSLTPGR